MDSITIDRRRAIVLLGGTALVAGCVGGADPTFQRAVAALQAVAKEVVLVGPQFAALTDPSSGARLVPQSTLDQILGYDRQISAAAAAIQAAHDAAQGQDILIKVELYVNALAPIIEPFVAAAANAAAPGTGLIVALVFAALPEIELLLNVAVSQLTPLVKQIAQKAPASARVGVVLAPAGGPATPNVDELIRRAAG